jgi:hypothetical protein
MAQAREAVDAGYQLVRIGGDVSSVRAVLGDRLADLDAT